MGPEQLESLVAAAQAGDRTAYSAIVQRFQQAALAWAYSIVGDWELAEDARQEAFLGAYCDLLSLREPAAFPGWFRRIVQKHSIQLVRRRRRLIVPLEDADAVASQEPGPDEQAERHQQRERIAQAIAGLPAGEREVTRLFYFEERSLAEISRLAGVPLQTVKSRLHTARGRLRQRLMEIVKKRITKQGKEGSRQLLRGAASLAIDQFNEELEGLLRVMSAEDQQRAVDLLCARGRLLRFMGRAEEARTSFEGGLAHPVLRRNPRLRARLRAEVGLSWVYASQTDRGREELRMALAAARRLEGTAGLCATILNGLGICAWNQGDFKKARSLYSEAAELSRGLGCEEMAAEARNNLALVEWKMGRPREALEEFRGCLGHWKKLRNRYAAALTLMNVGIIEENMGRTSLARRHYGQALALAQEVQFVQVEAATQGNLSSLALGEGRWQEALEAGERALELARRIGDRRSEAIARENLALACLGLGRLAEARTYEAEARGLARASGDRERLFSLELVTIELSLASGNAGEAEAERIEELGKESEAMGLTAELPRILRLKAQVLGWSGKAAQARRAIEAGLRECRRQGNRPEERRLLGLGKRD